MVILNKQQEEARLALETFRSEFVSKQEEVKQALEHHERILMGEYDARLATLLTNCLNLRVPKAQIGRAWGYKSPISADHLINRYVGAVRPTTPPQVSTDTPPAEMPQKTEVAESEQKIEIVGSMRDYDKRAYKHEFLFSYPGQPEDAEPVYMLQHRAIRNPQLLDNRPDNLAELLDELFAPYDVDNLPEPPYPSIAVTA